MVTKEHEIQKEVEVTRWMGKLSELLRQAERGEEFPVRHDSACSFGVCQLLGSLIFAVPIQKCLPLIHGPRGCANALRVLFNVWTPVMGICTASIFSTALDDSDMVYGGEEKLRKAIKRADQVFKPDLIAVLRSCSTGIIGDNVEAVCKSVRSEIRSALIWANVEGFGGIWTGPGFEKLMCALINEVMEEQPVVPRTVNLFAEKFGDFDDFAYTSDSTEFRRLLEEIGLKVHTNLPGGATVEQIRTAPRAELNVLRCAALGTKAARRMEERFGTPYVVGPVPQGLLATSTWLRGVGRYYGGDVEQRAEQLIREKEEWARREITPLLPIFKGKKAAIWAGGGRVPSLASLCAELGMEVTCLFLLDIRGHTLHNLRWFYETFGQDPEVIVEALNFFDEEAVFSRVKPDLYLCDFENIIATMGKHIVPYEDMLYLPPHMGYTGFVQLAHRFALNLTSPIVKKAHLFMPSRYSHPQYLEACHLARHPASACCIDDFERR